MKSAAVQTSKRNLFKPAMDIPMALDGVLRSLSSNHAVFSWKVCAERNNEPTVVIRFRPVSGSDVLPNGLNTATYKRKSPSQTNRDQKRLDEFKQRRNHETPLESEAGTADRYRMTNPVESKGSSDCENVNKVNVDGIDSDSQRRGGVNEKREVNKHTVTVPCESSLVRPPSPSPLPAAPRAAHGAETEMDTASGGQADGYVEGTEREESGESGDSGGSDTGSDTEGESTDSEFDQEWNRNLLKQKLDKVRDKPHYLGLLKRMNRNKTFKKIVLDRRGRGVPKLVCLSDDVLLTCDTGTQKKDMHLLGDETFVVSDLLGCVTAWPRIDQEGTYRELIETLELALEQWMSLVREMVNKITL